MTYYEWLAQNGYCDSGYIDSGFNAMNVTAETAIIELSQDFKLFLYGIIPIFVACVITYLFYKWFSNTFLRTRK